MQNVDKKQTELFADCPDIITPDELMKMLNIGRNTTYRLLQNNAIKSFRIGKCYKIPKRAVIDYISR